MKKVFETLLSRAVITGLLILLQIAFFVFELVKLSNYYAYISLALSILSLLVVFYIVATPANPNIKIAWIVPIFLFPLFGGIMYVLFGHVKMPRRFLKNMEKMEVLCGEIPIQSKEIMDQLKVKDKGVANQCQYLCDYAKAPVWENTKTDYYKIGEDYWEALKKDLEAAEHFIFMEYFIVEEGIMWNEIHEILKQKAAMGVEVRFLYDDFGSLMVLPGKYYKRLCKEGIQSRSFNPLVPFLSIILNNRDHRKITVIDGKVAYTGGINLADEYINKAERFGHWKDTGVRLEGDAVWSFTRMFLEMWNISKFTDIEILKYKYEFPKDSFQNGYVQPYGDVPLDKEVVGENVYLNIINSAREYVYIYTPYLIVDNETITCLTLAAKRGIDVRIVTPGIPDKKTVYWLTQSHYQVLIEAGVKIFQYSPGFLHAKCFLSDDKVAVVGTINMDYRSLYHHFECGVFLYDTNVNPVLKKDMEEVLSVSEEITIEWCKTKFVRIKLLGPVIKLFAPLM